MTYDHKTWQIKETLDVKPFHHSNRVHDSVKRHKDHKASLLRGTADTRSVASIEESDQS
jgi:hypothetical protein